MPETSLKNCLSYEEYIEDGDENFAGQTFLIMQLVDFAIHRAQQEIQKEFYIHINRTILHAISAAGPKALKIEGDDSVLMVVPMFHVMAWGVPYYGAIYGLKIVMPGMAMDGESLYEMCKEER